VNLIIVGWKLLVYFFSIIYQIAKLWAHGGVFPFVLKPEIQNPDERWRHVFYWRQLVSVTFHHFSLFHHWETGIFAWRKRKGEEKKSYNIKQPHISSS